MKYINLKQINCPICNSRDYENVYKKEYRLWSRGNLFIWPAQQVICKNCGMIFTNPQPSKATLEWFYKTTYACGSFGGENERFRKIQMEFIAKNISSNCKVIFDIGSGDGMFLNIAKSMGYDVFGIEPSNESVQQALDKYNIKLIYNFFDEEFLNSFDKKFDVVTIRHVLEHVQNPTVFLKLAMQILKPTRYIFIEVPDTSRAITNNIADFFSLPHLMHFTEDSLRNIINILGKEVVLIEKPQYPPVIRVLLKNNEVKKGLIKNEYKINKKIIKKYRTQKQKFIQSLKSRIDPSIKKIIIYGAGMHTTQLLQLDILDDIEINCIVDSNPKKHGTLLEGYKVQSPNILKDKNIPVLISSYDSQEGISDYLKVNFPHISQIKLYDHIISYDKGIIC